MSLAHSDRWLSFLEAMFLSTILENYLFDAFANASDNIYVYVTDIETGLTRWSDKAVQYFNLPGEYLDNVKELWLSYIHSDDRQVYLDDINSVFSGESNNHHCQYRARNRYGEYVWVECRGSIIYDNLGVPKVFAGIMTRLDNANKYDALTHLLSGYEFFNRSINQNGVMMMIGVDDLRAINSQHGVLFGNKVIRFLADTLNKVATSATIYRYWGDDFIVCIDHASPQEMMKLFRKTAELCSAPHKDCPSFTVSGGIVTYSANDDNEALVSKAELTLTFAKGQTTHVAVYTAELEKQQIRKLAVAEALTNSIQNECNDFYLVYQPIVSNNHRRVVACEALLRWNSNNPSVGACYPDEFIPILESNGGIIDVGAFVIREAIKQTAGWQERYPGLKVSINVSYCQMEDPSFAQSVINEIERYHLDPSCVIIELTESVLVTDTAIVRRTFDYLKQHGVGIALDDFGRGNSSFWMLHNFNVDYVKLDQTFIRSLNNDGIGIDYAIIRSTILLCESMGSHAIAEGIENETVYRNICDYGFIGLQGYLFSKPLPYTELCSFLEQNQKRLG